MLDSPLAEHIGLGLLIAGWLLVIGALFGLVRAGRAGMLRRLRIGAIGVFLISLSGLRIALKVHWYGMATYVVVGLVITAVAIAVAKKPSE